MANFLDPWSVLSSGPLAETGFYTPLAAGGKSCHGHFDTLLSTSGVQSLGGGFLYTGAEAENSTLNLHKERPGLPILVNLFISEDSGVLFSCPSDHSVSRRFCGE